jgi:hypothetical protein
MATDATGSTTLAKSELDAQGFPTTAGSARFIPFIDGDYDLWLFPTEAEADANDTTNAIQLADNLNTDPVLEVPFALWSISLSYDIPEIVLGSDDEYYRSLTDSNSGNDPISSPIQWEKLQLGRVWNTNITYAVGDSVYGSDGYLYVARVSQSGNDPVGDTTNWRVRGDIVLDSPQPSTSGTAIDFTNIPSWVKKIIVMFEDVSTDGTGDYQIVLGDSGGFEAIGYSSAAGSSSSAVTSASTVAFKITRNIAAIGSAIHGSAILSLLDSSTNTWTCQSIVFEKNVEVHYQGGSKSLSATLDRLRMNTVGGNTFDSGKINISYE